MPQLVREDERRRVHWVCLWKRELSLHRNHQHFCKVSKFYGPGGKHPHRAYLVGQRFPHSIRTDRRKMARPKSQGLVRVQAWTIQMTGLALRPPFCLGEITAVAAKERVECVSVVYELYLGACRRKQWRLSSADV